MNKLTKLIHKYSINRIRNRYSSSTGLSYAAISGCTSGIGKKYAEILAESGFNLILLARNDIKMNNLEESLKKINKSVSVIKIQIDFSKDDTYSIQNYSNIYNIFRQYNIKLLINNVGQSSYGGEFYKYDFSKNKELVNVNINSHILLSQIFINTQKENKEKHGIINISSYYGTRPIPSLALYSSSKAFLTNFSECLYYELKDNNDILVDLICINPLYIKTNMVRLKESFFVLSPEKLVYSSFIKIGLMKNTYGNWRHFILSFFFKMIPKCIFSKKIKLYYNNLYSRINKSIRMK